MPPNNYKEFVFCTKCHHYPFHCKKRPRKQNNKFNKINCNTNNCNINSCNSNRRRGFCGISWLLLFLFFL